MRRIGPRLVVGVALGYAVAGCLPSARRPGPAVEASASPPFLAAPGRYPTQGEAQVAVDVAVERYGLNAVYTSFGVKPGERAPARVALFACKPGLFRPSRAGIVDRPGFVHCHVDVSDAGGRLVGRATMGFYSEPGGWRLVSALDRGFDAR